MKRGLDLHRSKNHVLVPALALLLLAGGSSSSSHACGFHDPVTLARGMLSWKYPDALHVTGAIWARQQAGELTMPDPARIQARGQTREILEKEAFWKATFALRSMRQAFNEAQTPDSQPNLALVLIDTMLWTRFVRTDQEIEIIEHVNAPEQDDFVLITDEPVLHAIAAGRLSIAAANEKGLLRLYGEPEQVGTFLDHYGTIGVGPLPEPEHRDPFSRMMARQLKRKEAQAARSSQELAQSDKDAPTTEGNKEPDKQEDATEISEKADRP